MLNVKFKHPKWFKGQSMTVKQFLDEVISAYGDFCIKSKFKSVDGLLFEGITEYYLTSTGGSYKLDKEDCLYLASNNEYFRNKLKEV